MGRLHGEGIQGADFPRDRNHDAEAIDEADSAHDAKAPRRSLGTILWLSGGLLLAASALVRKVWTYFKEHRIWPEKRRILVELDEHGQDFDQLQREISGISVQTDENGIARGSVSGFGPDIAWFKDPAGNILSVLTEM